MGYIYTYLAIALLLLSWFLGYAYISLDKFDRRYIGWVETIAIMSLFALFWPVILVLKPALFRKPGEIFERDSYSALIARERDRVRRELVKCSKKVRFETSNDGNLIGEFEFPAEAIASYLAKRTEKDGYGSLSDLPEIKAWVTNADYRNEQHSEVPWVWSSFKLLAAELVEAGLGNCFCAKCRTHYTNRELESGSGNGSPGWIAVIVKCPKGHEVMKFDLMKPFCSHRRNPHSETVPVSSAEPHIPNFLKKGQ